MNYTVDGLKIYDSLNNANLQNFFNNHFLTVANVITATAGAIAIWGLFGKTNHKRPKTHDKMHLADFHNHSKVCDEDIDKIQNQLDKSIEKWGNINNESNHHNISNATIRP